jgi:Tol biopolymer transport system component
MESVILRLLILLVSAVAANGALAVPQSFLRPQASRFSTHVPEAPKSEQQNGPPADAVFYQTISWSPDDSRILFSAMREGQWNVYVMRADGAEATKLTNNPGVNYYTPAWSPDGKQIVFSARQSKGGKGDIFIMNADGSSIRQLTTDPANDSAPAWSPDGKQIVFISDRAGKERELQLYVMRADGSEQRQLVKSSTRDYDPQWSPDGKRIVYYAEKGDNKDQVWVVNADGSNPTLLTGGVGHNIFPAWMADSESVVFASHRDGPEEKMSLYSVKVDGSHLKPLFEQQAFLARVAHDGVHIGFLAGGYPRNAIYVSNIDGSGLKKLTP